MKMHYFEWICRAFADMASPIEDSGKLEISADNISTFANSPRLSFHLNLIFGPLCVILLNH